MLKNKFIDYFRYYWWKLVIIAVVLLADMLTKFLIVNEVSLIDGVLSISPTKNFGAGFSILTGHKWLLIAITFVFLFAIIIFDILFKRKSVLFGISTALIIAGGIGNLIDRLAFGYVRDFIYLEFINFPVFNVADMALTFGVVLLAVYVLFFFDKKPKDKKTIETVVADNSNKKSEEQNIKTAEKDENSHLNKTDNNDSSKN